MTPPRWVDEQGRVCPTRPCPKCQRVIPVNRWPATPARFDGAPIRCSASSSGAGISKRSCWCLTETTGTRRSRCWARRRELLPAENLRHHDLDVPSLPDRPRVSRSSTARGSTRRSVISALSGWPGGLLRLSVTILAVCSGVGAVRRPAGEWQRGLALVRRRRTATGGARHAGRIAQTEQAAATGLQPPRIRVPAQESACPARRPPARDQNIHGGTQSCYQRPAGTPRNLGGRHGPRT